MPIVLLMVTTPSLVASQVLLPMTYGDTLVRRLLRRHPGAQAIEVTATSKSGRLIHFQAFRHRPSKIATTTLFPLANALGDPIGSVSIELKKKSSSEGARIVADLSRHVFTADGLVEPDPFVKGAVTVPRGQALVEEIIGRHPALVTLAMHVAVPGSPNRIIASNFGRIGKLADGDDVHVIADGAILRELTNGGRRLAVELPLYDRRGRTIGALSTSFLIGDDGNVETAYAQGLMVRKELAHAIISLAALIRD